MENVIENNKLIAEFMGWESYVDDGDIQLFKKGLNRKSIGDLKFDSSWEWLMPVVEKIEGMHIVDIFFLECRITTYQGTLGKHNPYIIWEQGESKIEAIYKAVVKFIEWYNQQK